VISELEFPRTRQFAVEYLDGTASLPFRA